MKWFILLVSFLITHTALATQHDMSQDAIKARLKPIGQVHINAESSVTKAAPAAGGAIVANIGEKIYTEKCSLCHASGLAGAPIFHDATAWKARVSKGIDNLLKSAIAGLNAMPPRGTCVECSDSDLKAAILYMLPKNNG